MSDNQLLTIKEAAKYLQVHWQTIRNYIKEEKINAIKVGRTVRIPVEELSKLLSNNEKEKAEIEIRFKLANPLIIENKLRSLGAVLTNHSHVIDHYFCPNFINSLEEKDKFYSSAPGFGTRIRQIDNDYSGKITTTLEIKKLAGPTYSDHSNCLEAEIEIRDLAETERLLSFMDEKKFIIVDKERFIYRIGEIKFCFDSIKDYGFGLEIEKMTTDDVEIVKKELWYWAEELGLTEKEVPKNSLTFEVMQKLAKF